MISIFTVHTGTFDFSLSPTRLTNSMIWDLGCFLPFMLMLMATACQTKQLEAIIADASSKSQLMGQTGYGRIMQDWFQNRKQWLIHRAWPLCGCVMKSWGSNLFGECSGPARNEAFFLFSDFRIHQQSPILSNCTLWTITLWLKANWRFSWIPCLDWDTDTKGNKQIKQTGTAWYSGNQVQP